MRKSALRDVNPVEPGNPVDVDQVRRARQAKGHDRHQALTAREHPPFLRRQLGEQRDCFRDRRWAVIGEGRGFHRATIAERGAGIAASTTAARYRGANHRKVWLGREEFEPPYGGIKIRCLTTWLRPTTEHTTTGPPICRSLLLAGRPPHTKRSAPARQAFVR